MVLQKMVTQSGEEHGLINQVANSVPFDGFKSMTGEWKEKAAKQKEEEARVVRARYINHRGDHERLSKPYCRWAGDPIQTWHLIPGQEYDLPMGFIKEVNGNPGLPQRSELVDAKGTPMLKDKPFKIHELVPCGF